MINNNGSDNSECKLVQVEDLLTRFSKEICNSLETNYMLRRIQKKEFHMTWQLEDNFDPEAEGNKFTITRPEIFYLANPSMSLPLYYKFVIGSLRSGPFINLLSFILLKEKVNEGKQLVWRNGKEVKDIGIQKGMMKCNTINWFYGSPNSSAGGALSRWGDDWIWISLLLEDESIVFIDLMACCYDIFELHELTKTPFFVFDSNNLNYKKDFESVLESNRSFLSIHDPPLDIISIPIDTTYKLSESCLWKDEKEN
ncbi:hypothetical protein ABK040_001737 [Willaertia magna]